MNLFKYSIYAALIATYVSSPLSGAQNTEYYTSEYPANHWAWETKELSDPQVVALADFKGTEYAIYINPTDKRGYRSVVRLVNRDDMLSTYNRDYSIDEQVGLALTVQLIAQVYHRIIGISQVSQAGNNAHLFNAETGITQIGHPGEPNMLHGHVYGRGNPSECYIDDVKLDGPVSGLNFDMMGKTVGQPGNEAKVKWKEGQLEKVVSRLKQEIEAIKESYVGFGLTVTTE